MTEKTTSLPREEITRLREMYLLWLNAESEKDPAREAFEDALLADTKILTLFATAIEAGRSRDPACEVRVKHLQASGPFFERAKAWWTAQAAARGSDEATEIRYICVTGDGYVRFHWSDVDEGGAYSVHIDRLYEAEIEAGRAGAERVREAYRLLGNRAADLCIENGQLRNEIIALRQAAQPADGVQEFRAEIARIADDYHPGRPQDAALALDEMREALKATLATAPAAPAQVGAQPSELERLRNEVAALRVSLGQPADRPAEPIGCPAPGACSCPSAQPAPDMVQRHEKQLADWVDAHPVFGPAHRAYESSKAAQSAGRVENFIYEDVIANLRGEGPHRFVPEDGPGAQPAGRVDMPRELKFDIVASPIADTGDADLPGYLIDPATGKHVVLVFEDYRDGFDYEAFGKALATAYNATPPTAGAVDDGGSK